MHPTREVCTSHPDRKLHLHYGCYYSQAMWKSTQDPPNWKYPCGLCSKPIKANQAGIMCDNCSCWYHTRCIDMETTEYERLSNLAQSWCCDNCYTDTHPYRDASMSSLRTSIDSSSSSSTLSNSVDAVDKLLRTGLNCILLNARSMAKKVPALHSLLTIDKPHLVAITETHLDENITDAELVDSSYLVFRKDRYHQGGVMLLANNSLPVIRQTSRPRIG